MGASPTPGRYPARSPGRTSRAISCGRVGGRLAACTAKRGLLGDPLRPTSHAALPADPHELVIHDMPHADTERAVVVLLLPRNSILDRAITGSQLRNPDAMHRTTDKPRRAHTDILSHAHPTEGSAGGPRWDGYAGDRTRVCMGASPTPGRYPARSPGRTDPGFGRRNCRWDARNVFQCQRWHWRDGVAMTPGRSSSPFVG